MRIYSIRIISKYISGYNRTNLYGDTNSFRIFFTIFLPSLCSLPCQLIKISEAISRLLEFVEWLFHDRWRIKKKRRGRRKRIVCYVIKCRLSFSVMEWDGEMLEITRISRLDMGVYLCIATNGVPPTVSKQIRVSVDCE